MKIAIFAYSRQGCETARRVQTFLGDQEIRMYTMERLAQPGFLPLGRPAVAFYGDVFQWADAMIFVGSCGIAVREIAPHVKSKQTDPAVLVIDELASFVIALLSGHIGGANALALRLAGDLKARPVITTATDIHNKFSVDAWATKNGLILSDLSKAKEVSAAILEQEIPMVCDFPVKTAYPRGVIAKDTGRIGICISYEKKEPFEKTLRLIPPIVHLGIGCRKGTEAAVIAEAVAFVLDTNRIDSRAICCAASIDLKAEEKGLLQFCAEHHWPISFYSAQELSCVQADVTPSEFVRKITGIDNVCERAALMGAANLIVKKTARNGVTVALAAETLEVQFG